MYFMVVFLNKYMKVSSGVYILIAKAQCAVVQRRTVATKSSLGGALCSCGGLCVCAGGLDMKSWQNLQWFIVFHISIWGGLVLCLGGWAHQSPPWRRDWFNVSRTLRYE